MAHRDPVVDGDGVELFRNAAGLLDLARHQLAEVLEVHMPGHELGEGVDDRDDRLAEVFVLHAGRAPEAAGARHVAAMGGGAGTIGRHRKSLGWFGFFVELPSLCPGWAGNSRPPAHGRTAQARPVSLPMAPKSRETTDPRTKKIRGRPQLARLPLIDPQATTGDIRSSFDRMTVKLNIFRMMAHAENNMIPAMRFANSILHKQKLSH